ncbi:MAG: Serine/threonine-protein kinase TAO1 [Marteilia pararefringens]
MESQPLDVLHSTLSTTNVSELEIMALPMKNTAGEEFQALFHDFKFLGRGNYGQVWQVSPQSPTADSSDHNQKLAAKFYNIRFLENFTFKNIEQEVEILKVLSKSRNILQYKDKFVDDCKMQVILLFELCAGSLADMVNEQRACISEECFIALSVPILNALRSIHQNDFIHRDVRGNNILVRPNLELVLGDLGSASITPTSKSFVGSPHWMAPEIVKEIQYNMKVDTWSYGIIIFELCYKNHPYFDINNLSVLYNIIHGYPPQLDPLLFPKISEIFSKILESDPLLRYSSCDLLALEIFRNSADYIQMLDEFFHKHTSVNAEHHHKKRRSIPPYPQMSPEDYNLRLNTNSDVDINSNTSDFRIDSGEFKSMQTQSLDHDTNIDEIKQISSGNPNNNIENPVEQKLTTESKTTVTPTYLPSKDQSNGSELSDVARSVGKYSKDKNQQKISRIESSADKLPAVPGSKEAKSRSKTLFPSNKLTTKSTKKLSTKLDNFFEDDSNDDPDDDTLAVDKNNSLKSLLVMTENKLKLSKLKKRQRLRRYKYQLQQEENMASMDEAHRLALMSINQAINKINARFSKQMDENFKTLTHFGTKRFKTIHSAIKNYTKAFNSKSPGSLTKDSLHCIHTECKIELVNIENVVILVFKYLIEELKFNAMLELHKNFTHDVDMMIDNTKKHFLDLITRRYMTIMSKVNQSNEFELECMNKQCLILLSELFSSLLKRLKKASKNVKAKECLELYPQLKNSFQNLLFDTKQRSSDDLLSMQEKFIDERVNVIIEHICSDRTLHQIDSIVQTEIDELDKYWKFKNRMVEKNRKIVRKNSEAPNLIFIQYKQIGNETLLSENFETCTEIREEIEEYRSKLKKLEAECFESSQKLGIRNHEYFNKIKQLIHNQFCKGM